MALPLPLLHWTRKVATPITLTSKVVRPMFTGSAIPVHQAVLLMLWWFS